MSRKVRNRKNYTWSAWLQMKRNQYAIRSVEIESLPET